jgi:hypothetical protein
MKLLLDTHTFLWHSDGSSKMSATATALLVDPANELFLCMATVWEIAIKVGLKKLTLSSPFAPFMTKAIAGYGVVRCPEPFRPKRLHGTKGTKGSGVLSRGQRGRESYRTKGSRTKGSGVLSAPADPIRLPTLLSPFVSFHSIVSRSSVSWISPSYCCWDSGAASAVGRGKGRMAVSGTCRGGNCSCHESDGSEASSRVSTRT